MSASRSGDTGCAGRPRPRVPPQPPARGPVVLPSSGLGGIIGRYRGGREKVARGTGEHRNRGERMSDETVAKATIASALIQSGLFRLDEISRQTGAGIDWRTVPSLVALRDATDAILRALSEERGEIPQVTRMAPVKAG